MYRNGTHPDTGYLRFVYEPGDVKPGDWIITLSGERRYVKRVGANHVACPSWPEDVWVRYSEIRSVDKAQEAQP